MIEPSKTCVHFGGIGDCYCNNDLDNPGECVYDNGIPNNPAALCKYYDTTKPIVNKGGIMSKQNEQEESVSPTRIEIPTTFGTLFAEIAGDPLYPGIHICVDLEGENGEKHERQLALVECTPEVPKEPEKGSHTMRVLVWNQKEADSDDFCDDYSDAFEIMHQAASEEALP